MRAFSLENNAIKLLLLLIFLKGPRAFLISVRIRRKTNLGNTDKILKMLINQHKSYDFSWIFSSNIYLNKNSWKI